MPTVRCNRDVGRHISSCRALDTHACTMGVGVHITDTRSGLAALNIAAPGQHCCHGRVRDEGRILQRSGTFTIPEY